MRSEKQIQASRTNGARSRGPVTEQGKRNSARNGIRHGLLAQTVVLKEESADAFQKLLAAFMDEHQPRTATRVSLVETMAVARWRQHRVWHAQRTALELEIARQGRGHGTRAIRAFLALSGSQESPCSHDPPILPSSRRPASPAIPSRRRGRSPGSGYCRANPAKGLKQNAGPPWIEPFPKPMRTHWSGPGPRPAFCFMQRTAPPHHLSRQWCKT